MRLGVTCFLTHRDLSPAELAVAAEERGFASLFLPEHTHLPVRAHDPPALSRGSVPTTTGAASTRSWPWPPPSR